MNPYENNPALLYGMPGKERFALDAPPMPDGPWPPQGVTAPPGTPNEPPMLPAMRQGMSQWFGGSLTGQTPTPPRRPAGLGQTPVPPVRPADLGQDPNAATTTGNPMTEITGSVSGAPGDGIQSFLERMTSGANPFITSDSAVGKLLSTIGGQTPVYDASNNFGLIHPESTVGRLLGMFGSGSGSGPGTQAPY